MAMIALSVLDLAPITLGSSAADALVRAGSLARHAEELGYKRYWMAEHHSMPGLQALLRQSLLRMLAPRLRRSGSARAESCFPIMRR